MILKPNKTIEIINYFKKKLILGVTEVQSSHKIWKQMNKINGNFVKSSMGILTQSMEIQVQN